MPRFDLVSNDNTSAQTGPSAQDTWHLHIDSKNIPVAYFSHGTFWRAFSYSRDIFDSKSAEHLQGETQEN